MKWFGKSSGAPYERDTPNCAVPQGQQCVHCFELIRPEDHGFLMPYVEALEVKDIALHYECHMRRIVGGLNHVLGGCICCGGKEPPDPPELSRRDAARAALDAWNEARQ